MTTSIDLAQLIGDPRFVPIATDEVTRLAREGLFMEFDFQTFDGGNPALMLDQSGNGHDMTWLNAPTVNSVGVPSDGTNYAGTTLSAPLGDNYTICVVSKGGVAGTNSMLANRNVTDAIGIDIRNVSTQAQAYHGANLIIQGPLINNYIWTPTFTQIVDGQVRHRSLTQDKTRYRFGQIGGLTDDRTLWRIFASMSTVGGDHTVPTAICATGVTLAYAAVWNRVVSFNQSAAILQYLQGLLSPRGIVLS